MYGIVQKGRVVNTKNATRHDLQSMHWQIPI
jgi:hypothetical protein